MPDISQYYSDYPITHPAYNAIRIAGEKIYEKSRTHFHGKLLEIGCGSKKKGLLVGDFVEEHIGIDLNVNPLNRLAIDICGTAYYLPIGSSLYDSVLSTSVLEHLEEPGLALSESYRILKPGGYAIYTMPLFWHLHEEPRDFFRFTKYGLEYLFESVGFEIIEITPLSGFWLTFGTELNYYIQKFRKGPIRLLVDSFVVLNNLICPLLDHGLLRDEKFSWLYFVLVRKPLLHN